MAQALLARGLAEVGVDAQVGSAGLLEEGYGATPKGVEVMAALGVDTSEHVSRTLSVELIGEADLVLAMARDHLRAVVEMAPTAWPRTFTLKELVRRCERHGPRMRGEPLSGYLDRVHEGRALADSVGTSPDDDVADPIGRSVDVYSATAAELDQLTRRLIELIWKEGR